MPRPRLIDWASNANHPAGGNPWNAQPTKVEPAAGRIAGGFEPETSAAPEHINWLLNNLTAHIDALAGGHHLTHWHAADFTAVAAFGVAVDAARICHDASHHAFHAIDLVGATIYSIIPGAAAAAPGWDGTVWDDEAVTPAAIFGGAGTRVDIASDDAGTRVAVSSAPAAPPDRIAESPAIGTWNDRGFASGVAFGRVAFGAGLFVIGGDNGEIYTSPTGVVWTARVSGLAAGAPIEVLTYAAGAGAAGLFYAATSTDHATSPDGINWTAAVHGMATTPLSAAYSGPSGIWTVVRADATLATSDDDWATWAPRMALDSPPAPAAGYATGEVWIASDGQDGMVIVGMIAGVGGVAGIWVTKNAGVQWTVIGQAETNVTCTGGVAFGGGRFAMCGTAAAAYGGQIVP